MLTLALAIAGAIVAAWLIVAVVDWILWWYFSDLG